MRFFGHRHHRHHQVLPEDSASTKALCELPVGARGIIRQLHGGRHFSARIAALGFTIGAEVVVVKNFGRGPIIAAVRDTQVALGRFEAGKIQVEAPQGTSGE
jgi:Fe2+ transport system protein FeoA